MVPRNRGTDARELIDVTPTGDIFAGDYTPSPGQSSRFARVRATRHHVSTSDLTEIDLTILVEFDESVVLEPPGNRQR